MVEHRYIQKPTTSEYEAGNSINYESFMGHDTDFSFQYLMSFELIL